MQLFSRALHKMIGEYVNKMKYLPVHLIIFDQHLRGRKYEECCHTILPEVFS